MPTKKDLVLLVATRKELAVPAGHQRVRRDRNRVVLSELIPAAADVRRLFHLGTSYQSNWLTRPEAFALNRQIQWKRTAVTARYGCVRLPLLFASGQGVPAVPASLHRENIRAKSGAAAAPGSALYVGLPLFVPAAPCL